MTYFIIAGERSGDLHGANLINALRSKDPHAQVFAYGGEQMQAAGATLLQHYQAYSMMGFVEVFLNLKKVLGVLSACKKAIVAHKPDVVILIDFAGFNIRIAKFAKKQGFRTFYYISPKVWAWNQKRALTIGQVIDRMFVILPFEVDFYKRFNYEVDYVGNPLLDAVKAFVPTPTFGQQHQLNEKLIIALLPGSREQELIKMLPKMCSVVSQFPDYQFVVAGVSNLPSSLYQQLLKDYPSIKVVTDSAYDLLCMSSAALVTSGTATLETALFNVPQVVCYETSSLSYQIGKRLISVPFISLVNLIADKEIVKELIQDQLNEENLKRELAAITNNKPNRERLLNDYAHLHQLMGEAGASERTATLMVKYLGHAKSR